MKLSHTDLLPLLTIMAGGVLGASLSIGLLGLSLAVDVPAPTAEALRWNAEWRMAVERTHERARERIEPLETVPYRINFLTSAEMTTAITQLISDRGQVAEAQAANTVIVTDIRRVHDAIGQLIGELDIPTPQIMISAKIIFRTDLEAPGVNGFYTVRGFLAEDVEQKPIR